MNKSLLRTTILSSICCSALLGGCVSLTTNNYYDEQGRPVAASASPSTSTRTAGGVVCDCCRDGARYSNDGYRRTETGYVSQCDHQYGYGRRTQGTYPPYVYTPTPPYANDIPYTYPPPRVIYVPTEPGRGTTNGGSTNNGNGNGGMVTGSGRPGGGVAGGSRGSNSSGSRTRRDPSAPVEAGDRTDDGRPVVITAPADRVDNVDADAGRERTDRNAPVVITAPAGRVDNVDADAGRARTDRNAPVTAGRDIPTVPDEGRGTDVTGSRTTGSTVIFGDRPTGTNPDLRSSENENAERASRRAPVTAQSPDVANPRRTNNGERGGLSTSTSTLPTDRGDRVTIAPRVETSSTNSGTSSESSVAMERNRSESVNSTATSAPVVAPSSERVSVMEGSGSGSRSRISGGSPAVVESGTAVTAAPVQEKTVSVEPVRVRSRESGLPDPSTSVSVSGASVEAKPSVEAREVNTISTPIQVESTGGSSRVVTPR